MKKKKLCFLSTNGTDLIFSRLIHDISQDLKAQMDPHKNSKNTRVFRKIIALMSNNYW